VQVVLGEALDLAAARVSRIVPFGSRHQPRAACPVNERVQGNVHGVGPFGTSLNDHLKGDDLVAGAPERDARAVPDRVRGPFGVGKVIALDLLAVVHRPNIGDAGGECHGGQDGHGKEAQEQRQAHAAASFGGCARYIARIRSIAAEILGRSASQSKNSLVTKPS
jgi:hypothetical protein